MRVFAKLRSPFLGRGKVKLEFTRQYELMSDADRINVLNQAMRALRQAHDDAAARENFRLMAEDAENARSMRPARGGP